MSHPPLDPPSIPDYRLLALIGRGSYGDVWLARGITGPHRAIKVVWRRRFKNDNPFLRELLGLQHFAAVSLIEARQLALLHAGYNEAAGFFYYVMEAADDAGGGPIDPRTYVPNTLSEALRRRKRIPATQALVITASLAEGLAGLHARGLVHRDIKPSNIIFVNGTAKLADIGTVGCISSARSATGTPGYAPLEGPGTPAADIFSLGKVAYEILMGLDRTNFPRLPEGFERLPVRMILLELNEIITRACNPSPARRYADGFSQRSLMGPFPSLTRPIGRSSPAFLAEPPGAQSKRSCSARMAAPLSQSSPTAPSGFGRSRQRFRRLNYSNNPLDPKRSLAEDHHRAFF